MTAVTSTVNAELKYTNTLNGTDYAFVKMEFSVDAILRYFSSSGSYVPAASKNGASWNTTGGANYKIIKVTEDAEVNEAFYNWFTSNTTLTA